MNKLKKSPINYLSDLFIVAMVLSWIAVLVVMVVMAVWATVGLADTSIWCYVQELTGIPLTVGGAAWMFKNAGQHWIANRQGKQAEMDFPDDDDESPDDPVINEEALG